MSAIILIGMPSSGKSTAGRRAAELVSLPFLDTDILIEEAGGAPLSCIIARHGAEGFLALEEKVLSGLCAMDRIIATGGSAVYSEQAMAHLKTLGRIVYLKVSLESVKRRIPDFTARGVVMRGKIKTLDELYLERTPLYEKYADLVIDCDECTKEETASRIAALYKENL